MDNLDCSRTFFKNYESNHVVWPSTASVSGQHTHFMEPENAIFMHPLQVRPSLRYATANNDGARLDIYTSGFWEGKQTSEGIL